MSTLRSLVSTIRSTHKLLSSDTILTDRSIAAEIKTATSLLLKRETNLRKLWSTSTIFTTIPCLELIEVPISECCDFVDECMVSRSKFKLPRIAEGNYQYLIQGVWSINAMGGKGTELNYTTTNRYTNILKLPKLKKDIYYWIVNDYLYTSNSMLKAVRLSAYFEQDVPNEIMFSECCGQKAEVSELCKNPLDKQFSLPGYLEKQVLDIVGERLLKIYYSIPKEQNIIDEEPKNQA